MDCNTGDTFWTMCSGCSFQYRFVGTYHNVALMCLHCKTHFIARETAPPPNFRHSSTMSSVKVSHEQKQAPEETAPRISAFSPLEFRRMMMAKASRELRSRLDMWESSDAVVRAHKKQKV